MLFILNALTFNNSINKISIQPFIIEQSIIYEYMWKDSNRRSRMWIDQILLDTYINNLCNLIIKNNTITNLILFDIYGVLYLNKTHYDKILDSLKYNKTLVSLIWVDLFLANESDMICWE